MSIKNNSAKDFLFSSRSKLKKVETEDLREVKKPPKFPHYIIYSWLISFLSVNKFMFKNYHLIKT